jgi:hypothetical protein
MLAFLTILKAIVALAGFGFSAAYFFPRLFNKDKTNLKRAGVIFFFTWLAILIITVIEFAVLK